MANGRQSKQRKADVQTNGHHETAALAEAPTAVLEPPAEAPVIDVRPEPELQPAPTPVGTGNRPVHVLSYLIGNDTYAQIQVWKRNVQRRDGSTFVTYDVSLRKRYYDARQDEWRTLYAFSASELYAVHHGLEQAARWIAEARAAEDVPF